MSDELSKITKKYSVIIPKDDASPIAFINVFEEGDIWVKRNSCINCPIESREVCCGNCHWLEKGGICRWNKNIDGFNSQKSLYCIVEPSPDTWKHTCILEFECIKGSMKGKVRRVKDKKDVYVEKTETTS